MRSSDMTPDIPVIKIAPVGEVFKPTEGDVEGGINKKLNDRIKNAASAGNHRIIPMNPTSPHTTGDHMVFWIDEITNPNEVSPWDENSWARLVGDTVFLNQIENYFRFVQKGNPALKTYLYLGFVKPSLAKEQNGRFGTPLQSQNRPHFHSSELVNTWSENSVSGTLNLANEDDKKRFGFFANLAGEQAIKDYGETLAGYGTKFVYTQEIGRDHNKQNIERTMFGFNSLQDALKASIELQKRVFPTWKDYINRLISKTATFCGIKLPLVQSYISNIGIIIPSEIDRQNGKVKNDFPVWTMPFSTVGAQVLVPGGVITERATPYDSVK